MKYVIIEANIDYKQEANYIFDYYNKNVFAKEGYPLKKRLYFSTPDKDKNLEKDKIGYYLKKTGIVLDLNEIVSRQLLRKEIVHEMCHQAVREINNIVNHEHGNIWKYWMRKCGYKPEESIRLIDHLHEKKITKLSMDRFMFGQPVRLLKNKKLIDGRILLYIPIQDDDNKYKCYFIDMDGKEVLLEEQDKNSFAFYPVSPRKELQIKGKIPSIKVVNFIKNIKESPFIVNNYSNNADNMKLIYDKLNNCIEEDPTIREKVKAKKKGQKL